jgi:hypothetical protein
MDLEEARDLLRRSQQEYQKADESIKSARAIAASVQLIIRGILTRYPELAETEGELGDLDLGEPSPLRGADAVLDVLRVHEGKAYSVTDMVQALRQKNSLPDSDNPAPAVRTALERLLLGEKGVAKTRSPKGTVVYRYDAADEGSLPSGESVANPEGSDAH